MGAVAGGDQAVSGNGDVRVWIPEAEDQVHPRTLDPPGSARDLDPGSRSDGVDALPHHDHDLVRSCGRIRAVDRLHEREGDRRRLRCGLGG